MTDHPLSVGTRVTHINQQWASSLPPPDGTAQILKVRGPYNDGSYEYQVLAAREFSQRPGTDNPMDREAWWSPNAVRPI